MSFEVDMPGKPPIDVKDIGGVQALAEVIGARTMQSGGFRVTLDLPDSELSNMQAIVKMRGMVSILTLLPKRD